ncbi:MAG: TRAP transporter permease [Defluviitaleaceae bacterium]|nr:TRAP transporter permease [Defluviitaleaceae bacterium]
MQEFEKKEVEEQLEPIETGEALAEEEVNRIMSKYDPESRTRHFEGTPKLIVRIACVAFAVYMILINTVILLPMQVHRASFAAFIVFFAFLLYPASAKNNTRINYIPWYDIIFGIVGMACFLYYVVFFDRIVAQMGSITNFDFYVVIVAVIILFIACYRVVGLPLMIVAGAFLAYAYFGNHIPGMFGHNGFRPMRIVNHSFYQTEGVLGVPMGVASTFIFVFLLFGAFVRKTGIGKFFIDISNALAGRTAGGPAKAVVIVSALQATICGSSVANTVSSGSFTIPMMKKLGYNKNFAGAVEASASTGGQLIPPVMGAAAFIMAEITGIPFAEIALAALIPAVLYFVCVFVSVHLEAKKKGLKGLPEDQIPKALPLIVKRGYLMLGLVAIVFFLARGYTPTTAATYAIIVCIVLSMFRKDTRLTPKKIFEALETATRNVIGIGIACAIAGLIVGVVTLTGLGITFANAMVSVSGGIGNETLRMITVLFFCMLASLVLGMGVPTTAKYVIMATVTAPILVRLGVPLLAAHMFVFYFGTDADITPPVGLASYAGAAIAKGDPMTTSFIAARLAIAAYIVPYIFVFNPQMLFINADAASIIQITVTGVIGIVSVAAGFSGYLFHRLSWFLRFLCVISGILLVNAELITDVVGIVLIAAIIIWQKFFSKGNDDNAITAIA